MSSNSEEFIWDTDGRIQYSDGWELTEVACDETCEEGTFHSTTTRGATASLSFYGSQVTVNGYVFQGTASVSAKYSIDGGEAETRTEASNSGGQVYLSTDLFTSDALTLADHTIRVEVDGTSSSRNYSIVYFLVDSSNQGVTASSSGTSTTSSGTGSSTNSGSASPVGTSPSITIGRSTTSTIADAAPSSTTADSNTNSGTVSNGSSTNVIILTSVSIAQSSSSVQANSDSEDDGTPVGALVGGLLGGLGLLTIISLICFLFYREKRKRRSTLEDADAPSRSQPTRERHGTVEPFIINQLPALPDTSTSFQTTSPKGNASWRGPELTEFSGEHEPPAYSSLRY